MWAKLARSHALGSRVGWAAEGRFGTRPRAVRDTRYEWTHLFGALCPERAVGAGETSIIPDDISLLELPPCYPELNPIEKVWASLRGTKLAHRLLNTYDDITNARREAWNSVLADSETIRSITIREWATGQTSERVNDFETPGSWV